ncbi:glycerol-3-phosphate dehydrogenase [NAD(P)+] [Alsobacter metallidurans]|uniref:Glycerol-3-phosphate dehydrogenase [NAD(P)+] n=1 Tax=Alsobacter metallidurans TaxID=340221 RepID=A0A917ICI5_9HYPH|nr:NAD(P)H-dependent glycerol-3-phosphate dehydrogenase [Alsobacter metallidurans]GGH33101.1 glycerol-3-phosphate dehydrogenase [NAD(P)+] [Alsobacter metallidurans]
MTAFEAIGVVGGGAWGTALANAAARAGRSVTLWARDASEVATMRDRRENVRRLPGVRLEDAVSPTADLADLRRVDTALLVVPAQALRGVALALAPVLPTGCPAVVCAKGIERATGSFMTDVTSEAMPHATPAVLSGPSFAEDVSRGLPTAVVLAAAQESLAEALAQALSSSRFRVYHGVDMRGVEIGGAAKNVLAIAAGIVAGRRLGESARAALTARGFAELTRFARAFGGRPETLMGLSGLGDLILTCGSAKSRNFAFGVDLGEGLPVGEAGHGKLAEGAFTARALVEMARSAGVDLPICEAVDAVLSGRVGIDDVVERLMTRPLKSEG